MDIREEKSIKEKKITTLMEERGLDFICIQRQSNFSWFTCGRGNPVVRSNEEGLVGILITKGAKYLVSSASDANRVMEEELEHLGFELIKYDWYDQDLAGAIAKQTKNKKGGSDVPFPNTVLIQPELVTLRCVLTESEVERVRILGQKCAEIVTQTVYEINPGNTELDVAARIARYFEEEGIFPSVLMVGSDERIFKYRHPVATDKRIRKHVLIALVGQKWGLNVSISRAIYFGDLPDDLRRKQDAITFVDSSFYYHSRPGAMSKEILKQAINAYLKSGFKDEWRLHHQGGIAGYQPREYLATLNSEWKVEKNQLLGWNPTIAGVKSEDIILVRDDEVEVISEDPSWPLVEIDINGCRFRRPDILLR